MCPGIGNRAKRGSSHDVEDGNVKGGWVAECTDAECKCTDVGRKASTPEMQSFADRSCEAGSLKAINNNAWHQIFDSWASGGENGDVKSQAD
ncbi:hypothetical protein [Synechococcus sp. UW140]|uniref:hypothetical protein n=1 Tax=Synechococcus sp. UW140 TaxID=368503 RepID=UPI000E0E25A1|nr:hypothetical protein [Synechococcus sp. UW140]